MNTLGYYSNICFANSLEILKCLSSLTFTGSISYGHIVIYSGFSNIIFLTVYAVTPNSKGFLNNLSSLSLVIPRTPGFLLTIEKNSSLLKPS